MYNFKQLKYGIQNSIMIKNKMKKKKQRTNN